MTKIQNSIITDYDQNKIENNEMAEKEMAHVSFTQKDLTDRILPYTDRLTDNLVPEGILKLEPRINLEKLGIHSPKSLSLHSNQETKILLS